MSTDIIFSVKCLEYGRGHPEGPERVEGVYRMLSNLRYRFREPTKLDEKDLLRVHSQNYLDWLRLGGAEDVDTPAYPGIFDYACLAASGAILASEVGGFSLMRPPGHHAGKRGAALGAATRGFCYLNNVAVAVSRLGGSALILDIDGHHGNGTQEIFQGSGDVTYVSLHRHPHYPGTGHSSAGNCLNYLLPRDCGEIVYMRTLDKALEQVNGHEYDHVAVSAGFDTHLGDIASLGLTTDSYAKIGEKLSSLGRPTFFVLEGGYSGFLGSDIDALLRGFNLADH